MPKKVKAETIRKPEDETGAAVESTAEKAKRKTVSKREFIGVNGGEVDKIEEATGARYTLLGEGGESFEAEFGDAGSFTTMCAIFGFHTKVGNVANTVLNGEEAGTPAMASDEIRDFIEKAREGVWAERTGGVGARIDKDALAGAVVAVAEAKGKKADYQTIRDRLESDTAYLKLVRQVGDVAMEYARRVGRSTKSIDDILSA